MDIIKAILDIEGKAQEIMNTLSDLKVESDAKFRDEFLKIEAEMSKMATEKIEEHRSAIALKRNTELLALENYQKEKREKLEENYKKNHIKWVNDIFNMVIKTEIN